MEVITDTALKSLLQHSRRIAIVGLSNNPDRASYRVALYLQQQGYQLMPVNPKLDEVLGLPCYPDLMHLPQQPDLVDIFRRAEDCLPIVEEAISLKIPAIWLQLGIQSASCRNAAEAAGLTYVEDRCIKIEHDRLCHQA
ncbi:CoA-binding protein [Terasakiispira papahanaumokuakeensis]|uniref:CoA-binding protein n=1 Tax=Terasakiispira papahanaumokuakeensis TaxID=197479 RepID=A0A1E2VDD4_9GAMM|nr:CoA-binding protein [Terasakiispira papahanaumokuakeensis]ODC04872.1 CoA-binding protein [Terasakiispira papahanaumokuakeensis]